MLHRFLGGHPPGPAGDDLPVSVTATIREMDLNRREGEIAALVARGLTNDEIAAELFVSVKTVKNNVSSVYRKTGLRNRVELANFLQRRGEG
ncbi:MAG: response regulator transcription factor [bacterium]|nr:response regulator transcription factor [bacterium]